MCSTCERITPEQARAGIRPWGWVAAQWRDRNPGEEPLTPMQCKRLADKAIARIRMQGRTETGSVAASLLRDFLGDD